MAAKDDELPDFLRDAEEDEPAFLRDPAPADAGTPRPNGPRAPAPTPTKDPGNDWTFLRGLSPKLTQMFDDVRVVQDEHSKKKRFSGDVDRGVEELATYGVRAADGFSRLLGPLGGGAKLAADDDVPVDWSERFERLTKNPVAGSAWYDFVAGGPRERARHEDAQTKAQTQLDQMHQDSPVVSFLGDATPYAVTGLKGGMTAIGGALQGAITSTANDGFGLIPKRGEAQADPARVGRDAFIGAVSNKYPKAAALTFGVAGEMDENATPADKVVSRLGLLTSAPGIAWDTASHLPVKGFKAESRRLAGEVAPILDEAGSKARKAASQAELTALADTAKHKNVLDNKIGEHQRAFEEQRTAPTKDVATQFKEALMRKAERSKLQGELDKLDADEAGLKASIDGKIGPGYDAMYRALHQYYSNLTPEQRARLTPEENARVDLLLSKTEALLKRKLNEPLPELAAEQELAAALEASKKRRVELQGQLATFDTDRGPRGKKRASDDEVQIMRGLLKDAGIEAPVGDFDPYNLPKRLPRLQGDSTNAGGPSGPTPSPDVVARNSGKPGDTFAADAETLALAQKAEASRELVPFAQDRAAKATTYAEEGPLLYGKRQLGYEPGRGVVGNTLRPILNASAHTALSPWRLMTEAGGKKTPIEVKAKSAYLLDLGARAAEALSGAGSKAALALITGAKDDHQREMRVAWMAKVDPAFRDMMQKLEREDAANGKTSVTAP